MTVTIASQPTSRIPAFRTLLAIVYGVCVVAMALSVTAEIAFGYTGSGDQPRSLGEQLVGIVGFGTASLLISLVGARSLSVSSERARSGAVLFGILSIPALAFFWCGMPGMFGATAAHLAGLTRDGEPLSGPPRVFGVVGLVFAIVNPIVHVVLVGGSWLGELL